jgi:two-component system cell cycle response regulator DivK
MATKRILYIEDNEQNRRLIRKLLRMHNYEVLEAEDGLKGIAIAAREQPDLILMDINLPGIDGMEATSRLKSSPDMSHIPIIALTAAAMRGDRERIIEAGCDGYLQKPIDPTLVIETIRQFTETAPALPKTAPLAAPALEPPPKPTIPVNLPKVAPALPDQHGATAI